MHLSHGPSQRDLWAGYKFSSINVCEGFLIIHWPDRIASKELWEKLARSLCWSKYEEGNGTGLDVH